MERVLKNFLETNKELICDNKWCELYDKALDNQLEIDLAYFLFEGLGEEVMLNYFALENKIPTSAFEACYGLESITIPSNITEIGKCAFQHCGNLKNITLKSGLFFIKSYAFRQCSKLISIIIPSSVTRIGHRAFAGCKCHIIFECDKKVVTENVLKGFNGTYEFK